MTASKSGMSLFLQSYATVFAAFKNNKRIYLPFLIFAALETVSLIFLYLSPRVPLRTMMGPIISSLWGERFLHYPQNFLLLPKLAFWGRMVLSIFLGSLMTGLAVAFFYKRTGAAAFKKYAHLFVVVLLFSSCYYLINKLYYVGLVKYFTSGHQKFLFIGPRWWLGPINIVVGQIGAFLFQAAFAYAIPAIILKDKKVIGAIIESVGFFFRNFVVTLLLVGLPMLITVPLIFLNLNTVFLIDRLFPEAILWVGFLSIIVNSLLLDPIITLTAAAFYAEKRGK